MNKSKKPPKPNNKNQKQVVVFPAPVPLANPSLVGNQDCNVSLVVDDARSEKGQFGWTSLANEHVPYIYRGNNLFVSVRMVEMKLLSKYIFVLHQDIFEHCLNIKSYYISFYECKLLNDINFVHCDMHFGPTVFSGKDMIISLYDARKLSEFLEFCVRKLTEKDFKEKCGFISINGSLVPYVVLDGDKYVPFFYFEGDKSTLTGKTVKITGWDLTYLKFLYKVQRLRNDFYTYDSCVVVNLKNVVEHFPPNTSFVEGWINSSQELLMPRRYTKQQSQLLWIELPTTPPLFNYVDIANNALKSKLPNAVSKEQLQVLIPIADVHLRHAHQAYRIQKIIIDERTIPCINMTPFDYQGCLMICITDLNEYLFKNIPFKICYMVINALKIPLYKANAGQLTVLMAYQLSRYSSGGVLPLLRVWDVRNYLSQIKFMLASNGDQKLLQVINANSQQVRNY